MYSYIVYSFGDSNLITKGRSIILDYSRNLNYQSVMSICILLLLIPITQGKYTCEISLSLDFILYYIYTGVQFSFIPSQAITIQQTAVYKCSVDNNAVGIQWNVKGEVVDSSNDLGIIISGGTQNSSLIIPGNPELNNTIVICSAFGHVDGMQYINSSEATLFIQGIIICIMLFTCTLDDITIIEFMITGIIHYLL